MKICILTPRYPFPENGGDVLRINNIARYLKSKGHELVLVSFCERDLSVELKEAHNLYDHIYTISRNRIASFFYSTLYLLQGKPIQCGYYHSSGYKSLLKRVVEKYSPDLFISHLLRMTPYLESIGVSEKSIIEMTDALSKTYGLSSNANGSIVKRAIYSIEKKGIKNYERHVIDKFPKVVLVSPEDVDLLTTPQTRSLYLHSNGVEICKNIKEGYDKNKICFIGNMRTLQNQDAVLFFVNEVFPKILKTNPQAKFYIVGAEPPHRIKSLANENVIVTGFVDDLTATISDSSVAVASVRIAAGIQNKVLVAMGHKIPVVLTSLISKAIPELQDNENCLIRNEAGSMAEACLELMSHADKRNSIAQKGYEMVKESYSWQSKLNGYEIIES